MADNATVHFRTAAELNDASLGNVVPPEYSRPLFVMGGPDTSLSNAISFHETEFVRGCAWNLCPRDDDDAVVVDRYYAAHYQDRLLAVMASGVGNEAEAAHTAEHAEVLAALHFKCTTVAELCKVLFRAGGAGHSVCFGGVECNQRSKSDLFARTSAGGDDEMAPVVSVIGCTSVVVTCVVPYEAEGRKGRKLVVLSVGDHRVLRFRPSEGSVCDVTGGTPFDDPSFVLGPVGTPKAAQHMVLHVCDIEVDDRVFVLSPAAHRMYNPHLDGKSPEDLGLGEGTWEGMQTDERARAYSSYLCAQVKSALANTKSLSGDICAIGKATLETARGKVSRGAEGLLIAGDMPLHCTRWASVMALLARDLCDESAPSANSDAPGTVQHKNKRIQGGGRGRGSGRRAGAARRSMEVTAPPAAAVAPMLVSSGKWRYRAFIPMESEPPSFDIWERLSEGSSCMERAVGSVQTQQVAMFFLNIGEDSLELRMSGNRNLIEVELKEGESGSGNGSESGKCEKWLQLGCIPVNVASKKGAVVARVREMLRENCVPAARAVAILDKVRQFDPKNGTVGCTGSMKVLRFTTFGSTFKVLCSNLLVRQSDVSFIGGGGLGAGKYRVVDMESESSDFLSRFVSSSVAPYQQENWRVMSYAQFCGTLCE